MLQIAELNTNGLCEMDFLESVKVTPPSCKVHSPSIGHEWRYLILLLTSNRSSLA